MPTLLICSYSTGGYLIIVEKKTFPSEIILMDQSYTDLTSDGCHTS